MVGLYSGLVLILSGCCPDLEDPLNGMVDQSGKTPGSIAAYFCDALYQVVPPESAVRVCMENGQWSGQEPTCEREKVCMCVRVCVHLCLCM